MPLRRILLCTLVLLSVFPAVAQQSTNRTVNVRAELARKEIIIGDQINLTVNVSAPPGTTVYPISATLIDELPAAEVIRDGGLQTLAEAPELLLEQRILITSFDTGYVEIPRMPVYFETPAGRRDTVYTQDLLLTVRGAIVSAEDDILPIKPIIEEPRNLWDYWWVFALLGVVGLYYAATAYRRRQPTVAPAPPPPPPPHELALAALDELEQERLWQRGYTDRYYVELTRILRTYLGDRFGVPALEMTTRQIVAALDRREGLDPERAGELSELLQLSDLVKFAKATPAEELHPRSLDRVRAFILSTRPVPEPESTEEAMASPPKPQA
ncbi:hypothetical protein [Neolewinella litorea]|uniref:Protein BatD n=1 Tax=Neolewinella litorea TaxID=2562452 RepID=A0A4S4NNX0_9BACT|nr:hypothetical protein [Neolewinella litorea]THH37930.1 hypothetical protein E4021_12915 [Neolewinella litorea]